MKCLAEVIQDLQTDTYNDFYEIISPFVTQEKKANDEDVSEKLLLEFKEVVYESVGKSWPVSAHQNTQGRLSQKYA